MNYFPGLTKSEDLADWIEVQSIVHNREHQSLQVLATEIESLLGCGPQLAELAFSKMRKRQFVAGDKYPFRVNQQALLLNKSPETFAYTAFLLMVKSDAIPFPLDSNQAADLFEELAGSAVNNWLGEGSQHRNFGWPSKCGRPQGFSDALAWLSNEMSVDLGSAFKPPRRRDGGVDVVVWRPFPDKKKGFPIVLVQCTLQSDLVTKSRDIDLNLWSNWLDQDRDPLVVVTSPRSGISDTDWLEISVNAILFDRHRLARFSQILDATAQAWVANRLKVIKDA